MRGWMLIGLGVLAVAGCAGAPAIEADAPSPGDAVAVVPENPPQTGPGFDFWGTGEGSYFYHRLSGDCEMLKHRHGRNSAWGAWYMPLARVAESGPEDGEHGGAVLNFHCVDGTSCIQKGALTNLPDRIASHAIPFETMQGARDFSVRVAALRTACGIGD